LLAAIGKVESLKTGRPARCETPPEPAPDAAQVDAEVAAEVKVQAKPTAAPASKPAAKRRARAARVVDTPVEAAAST